jgi:hypothetical protein
LVKAPITDRLPVTWLLAVRCGDDLERYQVRSGEDLFAVELDCSAPIQARIIGECTGITKA